MTSPKTALLALEHQLQQRLNKLHADFATKANADSAEQAQERENDQVLDQLERQIAAELQQLHGALRAIESGQYGRCTQCGEPIQQQRLTALPYTLVCQHCA